MVYSCEASASTITSPSSSVGGKLACSIQYWMMLSFHYCRSDHEFSPVTKKPLHSQGGFMLWTSTGPISSGTDIFAPLLKLLAYFIASGNTWRILPCFIFKRIRLEGKNGVLTLYCTWICSTFTLQSRQSSNRSRGLVGNAYSPLCNPLQTDATSKAYRYSTAVSMANVQMNYIL